MAEKKTIKNPFVCQGYDGPEYFCDRMVETNEILSHFANGRNVTLVAPRRIGKTGLIWHVFHQLRMQSKDALCLYLDIFATKTQADFVRMFSKSVIENSLTKGRSIPSRILEFFGSLRPVFSMDPLTGQPSVSVSLEPSQSEMTLKSIFDYLGLLKKDVYVAIDEFQQVAEYSEGGTEALLRSYIQFVPNIHFIFSGSKFHLMTEMFTSAQRPFYHSTEFVNLQPLHEEIYFDFACELFRKKRGALSKEVFHALYQMFDGYTWYMQSVMNRLYEEYVSVKDVSQLNATLMNILKGKSPQYEMLILFLTENQFALLNAVAQEGIVAQPTGREFIVRHRLPSASSVQTALEVLQSRELLYRQPEGYIVYDRFLHYWLRHVYV